MYGPTPTVADLFDLANKGLGGLIANNMLSSISNAVAMINESFDECRYGTFDGGYVPPSFTMNNQDPEGSGEEIPGEIDMTIFPNPFTDAAQIRFSVNKDTRAKVELYNLQGVVVNTLFDQNISAEEIQLIEIDREGRLAPSTYVIVVHTDWGSAVRKVIKVN
jgi:hypothetical protein